MLNSNTTNWKHFVDYHRELLTVIADTLDTQLELMQTSYVDALVGQLPYNSTCGNCRQTLLLTESSVLRCTHLTILG